MELFSAAGKTDLLEDVLERERALLLSGDILGLQQLIPHKEYLLKNVVTQTLHPDAIERLKSLAARNQALLESCARGVQTAKARLQELQSVKQELRTYTEQGKNQMLSRGTSSFERRA